MTARRVILVSLGTVVLTMVVLWVLGGRERLTKSARPVVVQQRDEIFGDVSSRFEMQSGPVFGYYIGSDAVAITAVAAAASALITNWFTSRKVHSHES